MSIYSLGTIDPSRLQQYAWQEPVHTGNYETAMADQAWTYKALPYATVWGQQLGLDNNYNYAVMPDGTVQQLFGGYNPQLGATFGWDEWGNWVKPQFKTAQELSTEYGWDYANAARDAHGYALPGQLGGMQWNPAMNPGQHGGTFLDNMIPHAFFAAATGGVGGLGAAGAGLSGAASAGVSGATAGGMNAGANDQNVLTGAALGGVGGYYGHGMFGGPTTADAGTSAAGGTGTGIGGGAAGGGETYLGSGLTPGAGGITGLTQGTSGASGISGSYAAHTPLAQGYFAAESLYPVVGGTAAASGVPGMGSASNGTQSGPRTATNTNGTTSGGLYDVFTNPKVLGTLGGAVLGSGILGGGSEAQTVKTEEGLPDWLMPYARPALDRYTNELQNYQTDPYGIMPSAMTEFRNTVSGMYLDPSTNKYLEDYFKLGSERIRTNLSPSFGHMQSFGSHSGYNEALSRGLADFATGLYGGNYEKERDRQATMTAAAPSFLTQRSTSDFAPYNQYLSTISNLGKKKEQPYYTNPMGNIIGGGMLGYGFGKAFT